MIPLKMFGSFTSCRSTESTSRSERPRGVSNFPSNTQLCIRAASMWTLEIPLSNLTRHAAGVQPERVRLPSEGKVEGKNAVHDEDVHDRMDPWWTVVDGTHY